MTVTQLIALLSKFDPSSEVTLVCDDEGGTSLDLDESMLSHDGEGVCISFSTDDFSYGED